MTFWRHEAWDFSTLRYPCIMWGVKWQRSTWVETCSSRKADFQESACVMATVVELWLDYWPCSNTDCGDQKRSVFWGCIYFLTVKWSIHTHVCTHSYSCWVRLKTVCLWCYWGHVSVSWLPLTFSWHQASKCDLIRDANQYDFIVFSAIKKVKYDNTIWGLENTIFHLYIN